MGNSTSSEGQWLLSDHVENGTAAATSDERYAKCASPKELSYGWDYEQGRCETIDETTEEDNSLVASENSDSFVKIYQVTDTEQAGDAADSDRIQVDASYQNGHPTSEAKEAKPQAASLSQVIAGMTKNLIGCGALSLCNGIALCSDSPRALVAAIFWIVVMGILFGYFCWLIAKICELSKKSTYRGIWKATIGGERGSLVVSYANIVKAILTDLAYASILVDTVKSLFATAHWHVPRLVCLLLVTTVGIFPLCMLKNLAVLTPFSIVGTVGMVLTTGVMAIRYMDGSYLPGGEFYHDMPLHQQPLFGTTDHSWSFRILPFVCMIYEAYVMHYNSARFYADLKSPTLPRYSVAVTTSFTLSGILCVGMTAFGFLTFGGHSDSFILNNYSPHDKLATFSRLAVGLSTLIGYPIVFMGVRDGVVDVMDLPPSLQTPQRLNQLTFMLLGLLTFIAIFVTDLGLINAVGGGLVSTAIVFVFPALMYYAAAANIPGEAQKVLVTAACAIVGLILGLVGVYIAISNTLVH